MNKGIWTTSHKVRCGMCGKKAKFLATERIYARDQAIEKGWSKTKEFGWVCGCGDEQPN